jgi:dUTP pyrophosphatase
MHPSDQTLTIPTLIDDEEFLPAYMTKDAAGADIKAYVKETVIIPPHQSALIPTGIYVAIPEGFEIQIRPRSGLALKHQVTVLNTPATIDADYRGEIKVILINHGKEPFLVTNGMRIAQIVVAQVVRGNFMVGTELTSTERGVRGFGHTG